MNTIPDSVSVAMVTMNAPVENTESLAAQCRTAPGLRTSHLVSVQDEGEVSEPAAFAVKELPSHLNLGGAGGFAFAILSCLASGAEWVWMMDDDAYPVEEHCLSELLAVARARNLGVVSPLIVAPEDHGRLSFAFSVGGKNRHDRATVEKFGFLPNEGHYFNGTLVHRDVFFKVGLPDIRLFVRGDETDFRQRLKRAKIPFGTVTTVSVAHPPGWDEEVEIFGGRRNVIIPQTRFKRYFFFRNRGYQLRRYRSLKTLLRDLVFYPYAFLVARNRDYDGLREWWSAFRDGLMYRFDRGPHLKK